MIICGPGRTPCSVIAGPISATLLLLALAAFLATALPAIARRRDESFVEPS